MYYVLFIKFPFIRSKMIFVQPWKYIKMTELVSAEFLYMRKGYMDILVTGMLISYS